MKKIRLGIKILLAVVFVAMASFLVYIIYTKTGSETYGAIMILFGIANLLNSILILITQDRSKTMRIFTGSVAFLVGIVAIVLGISKL